MQEEEGTSHRRHGGATGPLVRSRTNGKACYTCHRRKVRCDILTHGTPCSNCKVQDRSDCNIYERQSSRSSRGPHERPSTRGATTRRTTTSRGGALTPATHSPHSTSQSVLHTPASQAKSTVLSGQSSLAASPDNSTNPLRKRVRTAPGSDGDEPETSHLSEFLSHDEARVKEISYTNRLYFIGTEFSTLNHLVRLRAQPSERGILHFGSQPHAPRLPEVPPDCLRLPGKKLMRELIDAYFSLVSPGFPIIHEEAFLASYNSHGQTNPLSLMLLNCILFAASLALSPRKPDIAKMAPQFYRRAKQLFDARYDPDRENYIQAALLFTWYCDRLEDVVSNSWHWIGVASRTAFGIGLHRDASNSRLKPSIQRHWVRLWWTLFQFDVMVSAAHGRPQAIDLDQSDVAELEQSHFVGAEASADFVTQHTRVCLILSRAMKSLTGLRATAVERATATELADKELAIFMVNLPTSLQTFSYETASLWVCCLHLTYHYSLLLLHRPPPVQNERVMTAEDARICSDAVAAITAIFDSLRKRQMLGALWIPSAYVLFATLVHVSTHLQSPNPVVAASSRRLYSQLMESLQALTTKWLFARSLLMIFQRGLSQNLGTNIDGSNSTGSQSEGATGGSRMQGSGQGRHPSFGTTDGPRPWWTQSQEHDAQMMANAMPNSMPNALDDALAGPFASAKYPSDHLTNLQLDFELFLAGLGTGDDAAHDFSRF